MVHTTQHGRVDKRAFHLGGKGVIFHLVGVTTLNVRLVGGFNMCVQEEQDVQRVNIYRVGHVRRYKRATSIVQVEVDYRGVDSFVTARYKGVVRRNFTLVNFAHIGGRNFAIQGLSGFAITLTSVGVVRGWVFTLDLDFTLAKNLQRVGKRLTKRTTDTRTRNARHYGGGGQGALWFFRLGLALVLFT